MVSFPKKQRKHANIPEGLRTVHTFLSLYFPSPKAEVSFAARSEKLIWFKIKKEWSSKSRTFQKQTIKP